MLQRRSLVLWALTTITGIGVAHAQRPAQPIARPPGQRAAGALVAGRFDTSGKVEAGASPGVYVVLDVDAQADTLRLRDEEGRTGVVHVSQRSFDLASLKIGEEVEVDFLVPPPGSTRLEAGGLWKVPRRKGHQ